MARIFLSYRREDSAAVAGRIHDRLRTHFGHESVFMDIDTIPLGADFRKYLNDAVSRCDVLLALIGEQWAGPRQADRRRLDDPTDFVRIELEAALARDIPVIPVLIGRTVMPRSDELPEALAPLVYRNAIQLDVGRDFHTHMDRLIHALEQLMATQRAPAAPPRPEPSAAAARRPEPAAPAESAAMASTEAARALIHEYLEQVAISMGAGMGGAWIDAPNLYSVWRKLNQKLGQQELIAALCDIIEEAQKYETYWTAINFLHFASRQVEDAQVLTRVLIVVCDHVPKGGHVQTAALALIQTLDLPKETIWEALLTAMQMTKPAAAEPILEAVLKFVPPDGVRRTGNAVIQVLRLLTPDAYQSTKLVAAVEFLEYREAAQALSEIMMRTTPEAASKIAGLLVQWNYGGAASAIRRYVDANHATVSHLYFIDTLRFLHKVEGPSSCPYIARILYDCHPYVQQNLEGRLGDLTNEPVIIDAVKKIHARTRDPEVKKRLGAFIDKLG
ncbi:MAG TPA: toll/interleukin-1 receptor domain-containing protein [Pyrinomonadaceae bacterium]|jgi:hypothetical protein